ncbi:hypothetical protein HPP92_011354 [Vanilla planifolia]|uniref:Uncharacterized protein n=1 Tax=Vanilla planifolia TaxID=51239 RepID=A0A835R899_VANPL|nr:hypothetical protein HPP92_011354 [Vanilla planifolia]
MGYDAMSNNASVRTISKDFGKKKKVNRAAKLKQWKLDARREQWLSQGKNGKDRATSASPALLNHSTLSPSVPGQGVREIGVKEKSPMP